MSKVTYYSQACYKVLGFQQMSEEFIRKMVIPYKILFKVGQHQPFCHAFCAFFLMTFFIGFLSRFGGSTCSEISSTDTPKCLALINRNGWHCLNRNIHPVCKTGELITIMTFKGGRDPPSTAQLRALAQDILQRQKN